MTTYWSLKISVDTGEDELWMLWKGVLGGCICEIVEGSCLRKRGMEKVISSLKIIFVPYVQTEFSPHSTCQHIMEVRTFPRQKFHPLHWLHVADLCFLFRRSVAQVVPREHKMLFKRIKGRIYWQLFVIFALFSPSLLCFLSTQQCFSHLGHRVRESHCIVRSSLNLTHFPASLSLFPLVA